MHASSGIRTHDPSVRAGEDSSRLRPRGHCDRLIMNNGSHKIPQIRSKNVIATLTLSVLPSSRTRVPILPFPLKQYLYIYCPETKLTFNSTDLGYCSKLISAKNVSWTEIKFLRSVRGCSTADTISKQEKRKTLQIKIVVFWTVTPCSSKTARRFGEIYITSVFRITSFCLFFVWHILRSWRRKRCSSELYRTDERKILVDRERDGSQQVLST
jgi:hypothetical protein